MSTDKNDKIWPYSRLTAFLVVPLIWIVLAAVLSLAEKMLGWPDTESKKIFSLIVLAAGFVPVVLVLIDFLSSRGAVLSYKDWKIDFSKADFSLPELKRESFGLPANIGVEGPIPSDSTPMKIIETLRQVSHHEIVIIDLHEGDAWWVTRLLALSSGAVRVGSPKAIVFVGKQENQDSRFLGWSRPADVLNAILKSKTSYGVRYQRAMRIAMQVEMYGANEFVPSLAPAAFALHQDVWRYTGNPDYTELGSAVQEQILMDQLARYEPDNVFLENPPDKLTATRLNELFGHCLYRGQIDLKWPHDKQISTLLESTTAYVALVQSGKFESMLKREDGERLIVRALYTQLMNMPPTKGMN
jgi:hypothetical protein